MSNARCHNMELPVRDRGEGAGRGSDHGEGGALGCEGATSLGVGGPWGSSGREEGGGGSLGSIK